MTDRMRQYFIDGLSEYVGFVGYSDMTYSSTLKTFLSTMLVNSFVKTGSIIIQGHESDADPSIDQNTKGYPFEDNGYVCRSINSDYFDTFLSYKIERQVYPGFETDTEFALNSVSTIPLPLDQFQIEVTEAKLEYFKRERSASLGRAGLEAASTEELAEIIKSKIGTSYIYDLSYLAEHDVTKFSIILEIANAASNPVRLLGNFSYEPSRKTLRLVTII